MDWVSISLRLFSIVGAGQSSMMFIYEALAYFLVYNFIWSSEILMQEKSEIENNQTKSSECWVHVDESQGQNGNAKRTQKSVRTNTTDTRNSFEPLRRINEELKVTNGVNQQENSGVDGQRIPSCSSEDRSRKTVETVSTHTA